MPETLTTLDGAAVPLAEADMKFAAAMAAPAATDPEAPPPPRIDPEAPYGRKADGSPRRSAGGRRSTSARTTAEAPRTTQSAPAAPKAADYRAKVNDFTEALWMLCAAVPVPKAELRQKVRAQAAVIKANGGQLAAGVSVMAEHSAPVRWAVDKVAGGEVGWILPACLALAPFAVQTAALWKADDTAPEAQARIAELAAETDKEWGEIFAGLNAQLLGVKEEIEAAGAPDAAG